MKEVQYAADVYNLIHDILTLTRDVLKEPNPMGYDQRLALLDTLEETLNVLREKWENDEDEDD